MKKPILSSSALKAAANTFANTIVREESRGAKLHPRVLIDALIYIGKALERARKTMKKR